jgi:hypothetical protein
MDELFQNVGCVTSARQGAGEEMSGSDGKVEQPSDGAARFPGASDRERAVLLASHPFSTFDCNAMSKEDEIHELPSIRNQLETEPNAS